MPEFWMLCDMQGCPGTSVQSLRGAAGSLQAAALRAKELRMAIANRRVVRDMVPSIWFGMGDCLQMTNSSLMRSSVPDRAFLGLYRSLLGHSC